MKKIERKDFFKLAGGAAAGGLAGAVFSGSPFHALQWVVEWTQDTYRPPQEKISYLDTVCNACGYSCELSVRKSGERAVRIVSSNSGCPFGQTALQMLYHPERVSQPYKLDGRKGSGKYKPVSWETAVSDISAKLKELVEAGKGDAVAGISRHRNLSAELLERLVKSAGSANHYYEPSLQELNSSALGADIEYDFENTDFVLSFGAKLFEGWGNPDRMNSALVEWKKKGVKVVQIDTNNTRTASMADEWVSVKPGTEMILALSMAAYLIKEKRMSGRGSGFAGWAQMLYQYEPSKASEITGVSEEKIKELADSFAAARNPVAVAGKGAQGVSSSAGEILAVFGLNDLVRTRAVSLKEYAGYNLPSVAAPDAEAAAGLDDFIKNGNFEMLFVDSADPVHRSVYGRELVDKLSSAFVVATTSLINNTAVYADYILPTLTFLEKDTAVGDPVVNMFHKKAKHAGDSYIKIGKSVDTISGNFPWENYTDIINSEKRFISRARFSYNTGALTAALDAFTKTGEKASEYPHFMMVKEIPYIGEGDGLAFPYVLKVIDRKTFADGRMWVEVNSETAKELGLREGRNIRINSGRGRTSRVRVHITDTTAPGVVVVPLGFGHKSFTKFGEGKGFNAKEFMVSSIDPVSGNSDWWATRVKIN